MSQQTNTLLHLFSKLLRNPKFMMATRMEMMSAKLRNNNERTGAQGLLVKLWEKDGLTNSEIAELLDIRPSSVTAQVKQLEERGYIERRTDDEDKRVSRVFLTDTGREAQSKRSERHDTISSELFSSLSEEEQAQLAALMEKLIANQPEFNDDWMSHKYWKSLNPEERQAIKQDMRHFGRDMHRMGHEMKREFRDQMRNMVFDNWEDFIPTASPLDETRDFGSNPRRNRSNDNANKNDSWDDF